MLNRDGSVNRRWFRRCVISVTDPEGKLFAQVTGVQLEMFGMIRESLFMTPAERLHASSPAQMTLEQAAAGELPRELTELARFRVFIQAAYTAAAQVGAGLAAADFIEWFRDQTESVLGGADAECWKCGTAAHLGACAGDGDAEE
jgi:hypothetical protein